MNFDEAFERLLGHEGGFVNDASDPGGATKYGISQRSYPGEDIANLTTERAKFLYLRDFWTPTGCEAVPACIRFDLFDMAVNSGVKTAVKILQTAVFATPDGVLGPRTLMGISTMSADCLIRRFNGLRLQYMTKLKNWPDHGKGWANRIAANLLAEV